ncbi:MAG: phosphate regulon sensor histidine kinase PhoR [Chromatiales bacterium]|nr:phosphate regulon sensor histidine kinase PhoR [Chromatiales bacterium]
MKRIWSAELRILGGWLLGGIVLGAVLSVPGWGAAGGLAGYCGRHLRLAGRMLWWLSRERSSYPPEANGIWDELFHRLYMREREHRRGKRQLRTMLVRFQQSTRAIPDALVVLDENLCIQWTNASATAMLGISAGQDRGRRIVNLVRHPLFAQFLESHRARPTESLIMPSPVSANVTVEIRLVAFADGQHILIVRDTTERQRIESMRSDFVANVSHELRTPLTVLSGYLENFQRIPENVPETWQRPIAAMSSQTDRMSRLVEDLLTLARIESAPPAGPAEPIEMTGLLVAACHDARDLSGANQHLIELDVDEGLKLRMVHGDVQTVVVNLISNAVHYTPSAGRIDVLWFANENGAFLEVRDNGPGISLEHLPRLTERFYRVDRGRSREQGGTGLGLAIVKHLLERYGASLEVDSVVGQGTTFRCCFSLGMVEQAQLDMLVEG